VPGEKREKKKDLPRYVLTGPRMPLGTGGYRRDEVSSSQEGRGILTDPQRRHDAVHLLEKDVAGGRTQHRPRVKKKQVDLGDFRETRLEGGGRGSSGLQTKKSREESLIRPTRKRIRRVYFLHHFD